MKSENGFTLIEVLVVVGLMAVLLSIATLDSGIVKRSQLAEVSKGFLANLQSARNDALTERSGINSWGYGIRFVSDRQYRTFEFVDTNNNYQYDGPAEEVGAESITLPYSITATRDSATDPAGDVFLFDRRGTLKGPNLSSAANRTYVLWYVGESPRCVSLSLARIREGIYNQGASRCEEF